MSNPLAHLAIQSWCFRGFKANPDVIAKLKLCGVKNVEMCGFHIDPQAGDTKAQIGVYRDAGIGFTAYGVHYFNQDEAIARRVFDFARLAGCSTISAHVPLEALPLVERLCSEYQIRIAIHNHGRKDRLGPVWALEELFKRSSANIGLCLDTAWMLDCGEDPVVVAEKFADRLYGLHVKDFIFDRAGNPHDVVIGTGNLRLPALMSLLKKKLWSGNLTIEYEGDVENPVPALTQCVAALHSSLAA
jgi:sugar phosphate isomerase/epimerase